MENTLAGKTLLITGGTSRLGSAFVRNARRRGGSVFFTYHKASDKAAELEALGARGFMLDLGDTAAIDVFAREFKAQSGGGLDVLIHNAAATRDALLRDMTEEDWDHVMRVDLKAPYYLTKKVLSLLFKRTPSKIFMITSRAGLQGGVGLGSYAAAKAGLIALAKSLAQELGKKQVLVNAVNPGFMISGMTENLADEIKERNKNESPLAVFSDPEEVADFLAHLSSDAMKQVTGQIFHFESRNTRAF